MDGISVTIHKISGGYISKHSYFTAMRKMKRKLYRQTDRWLDGRWTNDVRISFSKQVPGVFSNGRGCEDPPTPSHAVYSLIPDPKSPRMVGIFYSILPGKT